MTQSNQSNQIRQWAFDSLGRMTSQNLPESGTTTFNYSVSSDNPDGALRTKTDARGTVTTMAYGTSGGTIHQVVSRSYSDGTPTVSFGYNSRGLRTSMTDGLGNVSYTIDTNTDRLTQESRTLTGVTGTFTTGYVYNIKGDLTQMTYPSGRVVNFNYATGGGCCNSRLSSVVDQTTGATMTGRHDLQRGRRTADPDAESRSERDSAELRVQ
jgi:YD repeat-containing protein